MDKLIVGKETGNCVTISRDSYVIINDEVQAKDIEFNIIDCKAKIMDMGCCANKKYNLVNSEVTFIEVLNHEKENKLVINNDKSSVEYNIIDLYDKDVDYSIQGINDGEGSNSIINVASICYKNKNKNYIINTSNKKANSINEINCFGIVKDKSILNYEVSSLIEKGAKKSVVRQNSNILLFDEESLGKNNPILLIEENDVKASHGSSIGKIDDDTMFYLCSRGLTKNEATNLICLGKIEYLIKKIEDKEIKESLINNFKERMG